MPRPASKQPTELELEILKILWEDGPSTVRDVRGALGTFRKLAHTSVMTIMGIMVEKGQLQREKRGNGYVYRARVRKQSTLRRMMGDLVDRAYEGSAGAAAIHLIETGEVTDEELARLQATLAARAREEAS